MTVPFRYSKLAYAALNVTDLKRSVAFYRDIVGLDLVEEAGGVAFLRCSRDHHNIVLYQSPARGLKRVAFELESGHDVEAAFAHFAALGMAPERITDAESAQLRQQDGFRVRERHSGLLIELFAGARQLARPFVPTQADIARIGHVVIGSADFPSSLDALVRDFGFRVSDHIEDRIAFLRCHPNPFHHTFAVGPAAGSNFHHVNFMVTDIDDIGRALYRIKKNDIKVVYGPGRHPPSNSVFFYFLDPDGMTVEYSFGMEEFPEDDARQPRWLEPVPESLDTWGAVPDPLFGRSGPLEGALCNAEEPAPRSAAGVAV
ncbi:VOC family protein [Luteimonas sp. MC1572]|uniref:VOC family protein n=1 Tax=Luteimonas sp. MC1572 TaxID=2799325 RepID=UPI0018F0E36E|nr:VOC family protein [Luteimonas sp. MC1572]MBJ6981888.1 VOC family protein [Luteimonas sp. MC1572]QQO03166.1 VOC family protein [Luteimonas sp. MC1572]